MAKFDFGHRFHDLKYFGVGFFIIFLEFIIKLRAPLQKELENNKLNVIFIMF